MQLVYQPQDLILGQMNTTLNKVENCEVIKPTWKEKNTYSDNFFIWKRPTISDTSANRPEWDVVDRKIIDWTEYILIHEWLTTKLAYFDWVNYTQIGLTYNTTEDTPKYLLEGKTGAWEITTGVTIWDAYRDIYDEWIRTTWVTYEQWDVVSELSVYYIALVSNTDTQPAISPDTWQAYAAEEYGSENVNPTAITYNDIYKDSYLKIKLEKSNIRDLALVGNYVFFVNDDSNLQWIATEIYYTETSYIDKTWAEIQLANDEIYVYVRSTNTAATKPFIGESVAISTNIAYQPIMATDNEIMAMCTEKVWTTVTWHTKVDLYVAKSWDYIKDIARYNWVLFTLTNEELTFSRILPFSWVNFYPLDTFDNIKLDRIVPFGKMLVWLWDRNTIFTKLLTERITDTWDKYTELSYISTDLTYASKPYSKYSIINVQNSLYILQDDLQFMGIDIKSENETDYTITTQNAITTTKWLFDHIVWDIYMNVYKKYVYVLDRTPTYTTYYRYDTEFKQWDTGSYPVQLYKIEDYLLWDSLYEYNTNWYDLIDDYPGQVVWFDFGWNNTHTLKQVDMVKLILWIENEILDYTLEVDYEIGWILHTRIIDLKDYPINMELWTEGSAGLGDTNLWTTNMGAWVPEETKILGNFVSVTVGLGLTWAVFNFRLKSKDNWFIYWGSIIWYVEKTPTVTEFNYKH